MKFRSKLMLILIVLVVIVSGFYYFIFTYNVRSFFLAESEKDLIAQTRLARMLIMGMDQSKISFHQLSVKVGGEIHARVTIVDRRGNVIGDSAIEESDVGRLENHLHRPEIQSALRTGSGRSVRYSDTVNGPSLCRLTKE